MRPRRTKRCAEIFNQSGSADLPEERDFVDVTVEGSRTLSLQWIINSCLKERSQRERASLLVSTSGRQPPRAQRTQPAP